MKKFLALFLVFSSLYLLVACGYNTSGSNDQINRDAEYRIAMITDNGDINDQSFNQITFETCATFCAGTGTPFTYYRTSKNSESARIVSMELAIEDGYNVLLLPGVNFASAIKAEAEKNPKVTFIALDVSEGDFGDYTLPFNVYSAAYREEISGYMAGYAAVKLGYKKFGFLGGKEIPAIVRYGQGFVQGIDSAAAELGLTDVDYRCVYCNSIDANPTLTDLMSSWYADGVEVVFSCGGGIYTSVAKAAAEKGGKVVGVDVDQAPAIDSEFGEGLTLTSATKGLAVTVSTQLAKLFSGDFKGGIAENLGVVSEIPEENFVQLAASTQFNELFTEEDYDTLVANIYNGNVTVETDAEKKMSEFATVITVDDQGTVEIN